MPAVPDALDAIAAQIDSLAPRQHARPMPRLPTTDFSAIALDAPHKQPLAKRQQMIIQPGIIPTYYNLSGPAPGMVIGIVLGSVAGFLLIVWLLFSLTNGGGGMTIGNRTAMAGQEEIVVRRRRGSHGANRSRVSRHTQVREVSRSPRRSSGRSQIIVDERRPPRARSIIVDERHHRVPGDDVVEVIEEHDEYRERRGSRRGGYR
ncbi:hypothetical protein BKA63DRAFT_205595 [Paraphoma chrysanthemicola]|nr:hypothetical protein BKA63DRAFT_205595 [Paraphoma chrysanthemicola]